MSYMSSSRMFSEQYLAVLPGNHPVDSVLAHQQWILLATCGYSNRYKERKLYTKTTTHHLTTCDLLSSYLT